MTSTHSGCQGSGSHSNWFAGGKSETRMYPLGCGTYLKLCHMCWLREDLSNYEKGKEPGQDPRNWPQHDWGTAKVHSESEL